MRTEAEGKTSQGQLEKAKNTGELRREREQQKKREKRNRERGTTEAEISAGPAAR